MKFHLKSASQLQLSLLDVSRLQQIAAVQPNYETYPNVASHFSIRVFVKNDVIVYQLTICYKMAINCVCPK